MTTHKANCPWKDSFDLDLTDESTGQCLCIDRDHVSFSRDRREEYPDDVSVYFNFCPMCGVDLKAVVLATHEAVCPRGYVLMKGSEKECNDRAAFGHSAGVITVRLIQDIPNFIGLTVSPDISDCRNLYPQKIDNAQARQCYAHGTRVFVIVNNTLCEVNRNTRLYDIDDDVYYIGRGAQAPAITFTTLVANLAAELAHKGAEE